MMPYSYRGTSAQTRQAQFPPTNVAGARSALSPAGYFPSLHDRPDLEGRNDVSSRHLLAASRPPPQTESTPIVFVIDDDASARDSLADRIRLAGWRAEAFGSACAFLKRPHVAVPSCVVLDVRLPDLSGLELQRRIAANRKETSIIFLTGYTDIPITVEAMKAGAIEFFMKPCEDQDILTAVGRALEASRTRLDYEAELLTLRKRHESLSGREREVMTLVVTGLLNKQIAFQLGISEITVKAHRGRVMRKMEANNLVELIAIAARLGLSVPLKNYRLSA
jgi:FixJ family two-component response regulator